jgi:YfiH family protein
MVFNDKNGTPFLTFPSFSGIPGVRHAVFTREGGCSRGPFRSLNIGKGLGDAPSAVDENRKRVSESIGQGEIVYIRQCHGTEIASFRKGDPHHSQSGMSFAGSQVGDGMVTDLPGKLLAIQVADCQSVLMCDPEKEVVANVHSGWRGSIRNVAGRTVRVMIDDFGCDPARILAGIGPSLGPCCAEFRNYRSEIPESFWGYRDDADRFDFWAISQDQLAAEGLLRRHISVSGLCTKCRTDLFFSYRSEKVTGRFATVIGLT